MAFRISNKSGVAAIASDMRLDDCGPGSLLCDRSCSVFVVEGYITTSLTTLGGLQASMANKHPVLCAGFFSICVRGLVVIIETVMSLRLHPAGML